MADRLYLAAGLFAFVIAFGVQYAGYARILRPGLGESEPAARRRSLTRWATFAAGWQALVVVAVVAYAIPRARAHAGVAWVAPAVGAVAGTAMPLQLAVLGISRAARG